MKTFDYFVENMFHKSIDQDPYDITNYLVMADWLEENGDHRKSELIRSLAKLLEEDPERYSQYQKEILNVFQSVNIEDLSLSGVALDSNIHNHFAIGGSNTAYAVARIEESFFDDKILVSLIIYGNDISNVQRKKWFLSLNEGSPFRIQFRNMEKHAFYSEYSNIPFEEVKTVKLYFESKNKRLVHQKSDRWLYIPLSDDENVGYSGVIITNE